MINVRIVTVDHKDQRYDTVGDWRGNTPGTATIVVSDLDNWRYEFLIALHELIEAALCQARGISDEVVTAFDTTFEGDGEPGDDPRAPYRAEHLVATRVERILAYELGVVWDNYDAAIEELHQ